MLITLTKKKTQKKSSFHKLEVINITVHSNLCSLSFYTNKEIIKKINLIYMKVEAKNGFISIIHGVNKVNLIINENFFDLVCKHINEHPENIQKNIASLNVQLNKKTCDTPGQFYSLIQAITMQGINIREITSAFHEAMFYVDQTDVKLAFDTLYNCFCRT